MAVALVSESEATVEATRQLMRRVRNLAALRAQYSPGEFPEEIFHQLFDSHDAFIAAARNELGLIAIPVKPRLAPNLPVDTSST